MLEKNATLCQLYGMFAISSHNIYHKSKYPDCSVTTVRLHCQQKYISASVLSVRAGKGDQVITNKQRSQKTLFQHPGYTPREVSHSDKKCILTYSHLTTVDY